MAWGLVYWTMPSAPPPVAGQGSSASPQPPPTAVHRESAGRNPPPPAMTSRSPDSSTSMGVSMPAAPAPAPPPPVGPVVAPAIPASKAPAISVLEPRRLSTRPHSASRPSALPPEESAVALNNVSPACIVELEKLCEGTQAGGARRQCIKDNESKLSPLCQRQMEAMAARIKEDMQHFRTACADDVKQFCPAIQPGGGNVLQCLEDNYKEVSETCYQALKRFQTRKAGRSL